MPSITEITPSKSFFKPGEPVSIEIIVANESQSPVEATLRIAISHLGQSVDCQRHDLSLNGGQLATISAQFSVPPESPRGYRIDATLHDDRDSILSTATSAFDVLERWSQAPRYGFLSTFSPDRSANAIDDAARFCRRFHLNIVQFYDWMWRHYRLLPPTEEFTDALGRELSLPVVRRSIEAVQRIGSAAFAYGAVYGAEPEYADAHPEQVLHDKDGNRISLAELFYIMDIAPTSPWTATMIGEFAEAIRELDFDGIHLDQYGFPKEVSWNGAGEQRNLAEDFPPLIDAARTAVVAEKPDAGVIFNLVDNWPVETVAPTTQDTIYIEVWPPYDSYLDLYQLIEQAKRLGNGQQVILAAYLTPFLESPHAPESEAAALLATAVIASSGGFHLLLGEINGILCDPYYPKFGTLRDTFVPRLQNYYDHFVQYEEWLTTSDVTHWPANIESEAISTLPEPGKLWAIPRQTVTHRLIHLIDLRDQSDIRWNAPRTPWSQTTSEPVTLRITSIEAIASIRGVSPDHDHGRIIALPHHATNDSLTVDIPITGPWTTIVLEPA